MQVMREIALEHLFYIWKFCKRKECVKAFISILGRTQAKFNESIYYLRNVFSDPSKEYI